jgi:ABC-type transport system involved in multi-copper enzyme maturation permease subunit
MKILRFLGFTSGPGKKLLPPAVYLTLAVLGIGAAIVSIISGAPWLAVLIAVLVAILVILAYRSRMSRGPTG